MIFFKSSFGCSAAQGMYWVPLLNVGTLSRGLLAVSGVICGSSAIFCFVFSRLQGGALWAAPGLFGCN
jgi:hypothetical protein